MDEKDVEWSLNNLSEQLTALTTIVRVLISTHPDRDAVDSSLADAQFRLGAVMNATSLPDDSNSRLLALLQDARVIARRR